MCAVVSPGLKRMRYLRQAVSLRSSCSSCRRCTSSWPLCIIPFRVIPAWAIKDASSTWHTHRHILHKINTSSVYLCLYCVWFECVCYLLSSNEKHTVLFPMMQLSGDVVQHKQLTPAVMQQLHLISHLWSRKKVNIYIIQNTIKYKIIPNMFILCIMYVDFYTILLILLY